MRHFSGEPSGLRLLMEDELEKIAGGEGEDTDDSQCQSAGALGWIAGAAKDLIVGIVGNSVTVTLQKESRVSSMIDPANVVGNSLGIATQDGVVTNVRTWHMTNGDVFIDRNGNEKPDLVLRPGLDGSVFQNEGDGWQMIYDRG